MVRVGSGRSPSRSLDSARISSSSPPPSRRKPRSGLKGFRAHHVIDHSRPLAPQIAELNIGAPAFVFSTTHTEQHASDIVELIAPQGRFGFIDDPKALDVILFKRKAVSIHHRLMFTVALRHARHG